MSFPKVVALNVDHMNGFVRFSFGLEPFAWKLILSLQRLIRFHPLVVASGVAAAGNLCFGLRRDFALCDLAETWSELLVDRFGLR